MTVYTLFLYIGIAGLVLTAIFGLGHSKLKKHPVMHPVQWYVQYFIGALLIFSGAVKAVDPLGTAYKMKDYFTEFDNQGLPLMELMHSFAVEFSIGMLVLELSLGVLLILGIGQRITTWTNLAMMLFFTFLTGFNYLTGFTPKPEGVGLLEFSKWTAFSAENIRITDCGCFGDFMKLKPIETFTKDIIFTTLSLFLVFNTSKLKELVSRDLTIGGKLKVRQLLTFVVLLISAWFCFDNYLLDKPSVDFRPFAEGIDLRKAKEDCANHQPVIESFYVYVNEETKEEKAFLSTNLPNAPWKYKALGEKKILDKGCSSQIQYFNFDDILSHEGYQLFVVAGDLTKTDQDAFKKISILAKSMEAKKIPTQAKYYYVEGEIDAFRHTVNAAYPFGTADDKLLKTIVRANPGLLLIKDGVVVKKWHHKHIPSVEELQTIVK